MNVASPSPVVVITGASAGVGRATARLFGQRGWRVALLARGEDGLQGASLDVERLGGQALALSTDVADEKQVEAAVDQVIAKWGVIDVWVNNAMATIFAPISHITPADFRRATEVTYLGAVWGTLCALRRMREQGHGVIVQIGSALAYRSIPLQAPYCGAKSAIRGFTDSVRCELAHEHSKIHITMVHLSAFNTPQFEWGRTSLDKRPRPMGKIFQPELAARAVFHAATHRRREVWMGWPTVQSILGQRLIPDFLDRYLGKVAVDGQHTDEPLPSPRPDNLYTPVPGDRGAHGRFGSEAHDRSSQLWLTMHRGAMTAAAVAMLALAGGLLAWWTGS